MICIHVFTTAAPMFFFFVLRKGKAGLNSKSHKYFHVESCVESKFSVQLVSSSCVDNFSPSYSVAWHFALHVLFGI